MENEQRIVLPPRPTPPSQEGEEHERWCRDQSIAYDGGTITSAYGNIAQTWSPGEIPPVTVGKDINRDAYKAKRRNKYSDPIKEVSVPASTYKRYPNKRSSSAAAGEVFVFRTRDGDFTARVTGDIQDLIKWVSSVRMQQYMEFTIYSNRGAAYGPFTPLTILS